ncbi:MAG: GNAT family N-acetyltransferase [Paracoccaceae bacterium]
MTVEIVDLNATYLSDVAKVWHTGWHEAHAQITPPPLTALRTKEDFERRLREASFPVFVAVEQGAVLGFVATIENQLYQIFVAKAAQGKGVASALMEAAVEQMQASEAKSMWLSCAVENHRAIAFYEKTGWHNKGQNVVSVDTSDGPFDLNVLRFEKAF